MSDPLTLEYTGTLLHAAEVRNKPLDRAGLTVPVLCLDIELDNELHTHMHVEQLFKPDQHSQCAAAAHRFPKGTRIKVQAPLISTRLVATASHLHIINPNKEASHG